MVRKHRNRMHSAIQQVAASLTGYAFRRRFAVVRYDDSDHSFSEQFPWHELKQRIQTRLNEANIGFENTGAAPE